MTVRPPPTEDVVHDDTRSNLAHDLRSLRRHVRKDHAVVSKEHASPLDAAKPRGVRAQKWDTGGFEYQEVAGLIPLSGRAREANREQSGNNLLRRNKREGTRIGLDVVRRVERCNTIIYIRVRDYGLRGRYCFSDWANIILDSL